MIENFGRPRFVNDNPKKIENNPKRFEFHHIHSLINEKATAFQVIIDGRVIETFSDPGAAIEYLNEAIDENSSHCYYISMPPQLRHQFRVALAYFSEKIELILNTKRELERLKSSLNNQSNLHKN